MHTCKRMSISRFQLFFFVEEGGIPFFNSSTAQISNDIYYIYTIYIYIYIYIIYIYKRGEEVKSF